MTDNLQFDSRGRLRHLLTIEGMSRQTLLEILDTAESFITVGEREIKKVPLLRGKTVVNLFFESSTRTRTTFEIAAKRLSADVINLNCSISSTNKGETVLDTIRNLEAMRTDLFVVRHHLSGAAHLIATHMPDEVAVEAFLAGTVPFPAVVEVVEEVLESVPSRPADSVRAVVNADREARETATGLLEARAR